VILTINVDVSAATFKDAGDNNINAAEFFSAISPGDPVEAKGNFDGLNLIAEKAEIED